ncbi:hypothetical protein [Sphingosinicella sp. BN140058]|uniref:DUF6916 family protein n=1 Tax=Sphingosinicella sp. BN140058 TaxID=1892855 RepID=UPI001011C34E|nr:hypothetical protein [Sphingosinicella sp. BN140058]QAY75202.1 hypothetical protein ETR14_00635 [Sphingosinicella sp. BN140058]
MADLTASDFAEGQHYDVAVGETVLKLVVQRVQPLEQAIRAAGGFRLEFLGPADPILPQAIYPFAGQGETKEIFIVPIGRSDAGTQYEAIFN